MLLNAVLICRDEGCPGPSSPVRGFGSRITDKVLTAMQASQASNVGDGVAGPGR